MVNSSANYWIAANALSISLNALGDANRIQCGLATGSVIMCYIKGVGPTADSDGLEYDNGHNYRRWPLTISPTYFNTYSKKYVYVAIPKSAKIGNQAMVVFPSQKIDIYGYVVLDNGESSNERIGNDNYYYIWLQGIISSSGEQGTTNRTWEVQVESGTLSTDEAVNPEGGKWYEWNNITQTVTFLKEIFMDTASRFFNIRLGNHNLTGVAVDDTIDEDSTSDIVTPAYVKAVSNDRYLRKDQDDYTPYLLGVNRLESNHIQSTEYTGDGLLDTGYRLWYEEGRAKLVIDDLVARGKFSVNELETRIWTYAGGNMVFSGAGSTIFFVEYLDANENALGYTYINQPWLLRGRALLAGGLAWSKRKAIQRELTEAEKAQVVKFRCYEYSDDGTMQTRNWWKPNDIAMCETLNKVREKAASDGSYSGSASNTVYKRRIAGIGSKEIPMLNDGRVYDYVDIWNIYDLAGNSCKYKGTDGQEHLITDSVKGYDSTYYDWPAAGDVIVQMGNPLDTDRQSAVTIEVQGEGLHGFKVYDTISDYSLANDLWVEIGYSPTTGKAKANVFGDFRFGCRENEEAQGGSYIKYNRTTKQLDIKATVHFTSPITHEETNLDTFANAVVGDLSNLQSQIDGQIESWFYNYSPVHVDSEGVPDSNVPLNVAPYSDWNTDALKIAHLGDTFTNNETGYCWRFSRNATTNAFEWVIIEDSAVIKALQDAARAQDTADHKRRVFICDSSNQTPTPPYDAGDLWVNVKYPWATGAIYDNEMLKCVTSKASGASFSISDWSLANGYTAKLNNFVTNTYSPFVTQITEQVDKKAETWRQATDPSTPWYDDTQTPVVDVRIHHIGDLWYNTGNNNNFKYQGTYIYENTGTDANPVYGWVEEAIPDEVFDKIDGKAAIYVTWNAWIVSGVNQLNDKDLFIPNADAPSGSTFAYKANKVYRWDATNSTWNEIDYTNDSAFNGYINAILNNTGASGDAAIVAAAQRAVLRAVKGDTVVEGGLLLTSLIAVRQFNGSEGQESDPTKYTTWGGISGIYDTTAKGNGIAAWFGGAMVDKEDVQTLPASYAKSLFRMDGTGYVAGGNISWNLDGGGKVADGKIRWDGAGNLTAANFSGVTTQLGNIQINNETISAAQLLDILGMFEKENIADEGETPVYVIKANYSLYSVGGLSALGQGSGGGGGGQGDVTWEALASDNNNNQIASSHLTDLLGGTFTGKNYALQRNNNGKLYVNVPWTDTIYTLPDEVSYRCYDFNASTAAGGKWHRLGNYKTSGMARSFVIEVYDGAGYSARATQNATTKITIKDGYQETEAAENSVGILVERSGITSFVTEVSVVATSSREGAIWIYLPGQYVNGSYSIYGSYESWEHNEGTSDDTTTRPATNQTHTGNQPSYLYYDLTYNSSVSKSGNTLTVKINGVEKSLENTDHYDWSDITSKPTAEGGSSSPVYWTGSAFTACDKPLSGAWFKGVVTIGNNGVMEVGRYIDFHPTDGSTLDFNVRLDAGTGTTERTFTFPSVAGTLLSSGNSSVSLSNDNQTLTVKINGVEKSLTNTNTWRPLGNGATDACAGNDSRLSDSRPASDVYNWAKQSTKPSYNLDEVSDGSTRALANYLPLAGGSLSGALALAAGQYNGYKTGDARSYGLNANNSDIVGINALITADLSDGWDESIGFARTNGHYDTFRAADGVFYFGFNGYYDSDNVEHAASEIIQLKSTGSIECVRADTSDSRMLVSNTNSSGNSVMLLASTNRGLYLENKGWIVASDGTNCWSAFGNFGIGTTSPSYKLHVAGDIYATGGVTCLSDIRKKNVIDYELPLTIEQIAEAPTIRFTWKDNREEGEQVGTVAQYWQKVLPQVTRDKNDELSMQYGVAALVGLIKTTRKVVDHDKLLQEQARKIEEQAKEICELKEELYKLKIA